MASFSIDAATYNKPAHYPVGHGYGVRPAAPTSAVVHSTNNKATTSFESEANFLYTSPDVTADYLVGKDGRIVQFIDSARYYAWHAGGQQANGTWTARPAYANHKSIGIELHKSLPDPFYPQVQLDALAWLLGDLIRRFPIDYTKVETHGQIALPGPYIRKSDPDKWPHANFIAWRDQHFANVAAWAVYEVVAPCSVFTDRSPAAPLAGGPTNGQTQLTPGALINVGDVTNGWAWVSDSTVNPPGIGFLPLSYVKGPLP